MKFDCGETEKEKEERLFKWHKKFCWWPLNFGDHDCRWLEFVWARKIIREDRFVQYRRSIWQYKTISEDNEHGDEQHTQGEQGE